MFKVTTLATATAIALAAPVSAETYKVAHVFSAKHWMFSEGITTFMNNVKELSGGAIDFEVYHAGQLGKESTVVIGSGLADMGVINASYEVEKLALSSVAELPGFHNNSCQGGRRQMAMSGEDGILHKEEYSKLGIRVVYTQVLPPYTVQTNTKVVESVEDMKGLKLRANGSMAKAVNALGGVPLQVTSPEFYDALKRGVVDGGMWPVGSTRQVGLEDVLNHEVDGPAMGGGVATFVINEKVFQSMDKATQDLIMEAGRRTTDYMCNWLDNKDASERADMVAAGTLTVHKLSDEEAAKWSALTAHVAEEWVAEMESKGRPGKAVYAAQQEAVKSIE